MNVITLLLNILRDSATQSILAIITLVTSIMIGLSEKKDKESLSSLSQKTLSKRISSSKAKRRRWKRTRSKQ